MSQLAESLLKCKVEGNTLFLPPMSDGPLANYSDVRKALLNAGATYKKNSFIFPSEAQPFIDRLTGGESVNIKKEFQFFATPNKLADRLVELAEITEGMSVLEPSAGQGAIIESIYRASPRYMKGPNEKPSISVDYYELMEINRNILSKKLNASERWSSSTSCMGDDFLTAAPSFKYDRIIANPPFSKNQDIDHIKHMHTLCKDGGRIVTIASRHWYFAKNKKETQFREWLKEIGAEVIELDNGEFKESGTSIAACIIIINK